MIDSTGAGACPQAAVAQVATAQPDGGVMDPWWSPAFHAIHTIATEAFPRDRRVWQHIGVDAQDVDCDEILAAGTYSTTEHLLLQVGASLWSGSDYSASFGQIANLLDDEQLATVLRALCAARGTALPNLVPFAGEPAAPLGGASAFHWNSEPLRDRTEDESVWTALLRWTPEYAAVRVIAMEAFPHDTRIWPYIDDDLHQVRFSQILRDHHFDGTERLLLHIAASLHNGCGYPTSLGAVAALSDGTLSVVLRGLAAARGGSLPAPAAW